MINSGDGLKTLDAIADQAAAQGQTPQPESTSTKPSALKSAAPPAIPITPLAASPAAAPATPQPSPAQVAPGQSVVQIAAVSHQEDADALQAALKAHGYNVFIRKEPQDKLLHVQIGPFPTRKDADVMKQRLLADGYNAIVK